MEKRTPKEQFDYALELLKQSSELYTKALIAFSNIGVEAYSSRRPIELFMNNPRKKEFYIHKGVDKVAEINGTDVQVGMPFYDEVDENYSSTVVDGIVFHERV